MTRTTVAPCPDGCGAVIRLHGRTGPAFNTDRTRGTSSFHTTATDTTGTP